MSHEAENPLSPRVKPGRLLGSQHLTDGRGHLVPMLKPIRLGDRFSWRRHMTSTERRRWGGLIALNAMFLLGVLLLGGTVGLWGFLALCGVSLLFSFCGAWVFDRRVKIPGTAAARIERGLCGSCVYPIETTSPQPDGCTVCPECGAAWKLPPPPPNNPA
ncbi:MAG: hypothetical protein K2Y21_07560 [Phycisphaerales bacterium]|nr:hypothetical protein [Phycisphaerales bacterium]